MVTLFRCRWNDQKKVMTTGRASEEHLVSSVTRDQRSSGKEGGQGCLQLTCKKKLVGKEGEREKGVADVWWISGA